MQSYGSDLNLLPLSAAFDQIHPSWNSLYSCFLVTQILDPMCRYPPVFLPPNDSLVATFANSSTMETSIWRSRDSVLIYSTSRFVTSCSPAAVNTIIYTLKTHEYSPSPQTSSPCSKLIYLTAFSTSQHETQPQFQSRTFDIPLKCVWPIFVHLCKWQHLLPTRSSQNPRNQLWLPSFQKSLIYNTQQEPLALFPNRPQIDLLLSFVNASTQATINSHLGCCKWLFTGLPIPTLDPLQWFYS